SRSRAAVTSHGRVVSPERSHRARSSRSSSPRRRSAAIHAWIAAASSAEQSPSRSRSTSASSIMEVPTSTTPERELGMKDPGAASSGDGRQLLPEQHRRPPHLGLHGTERYAEARRDLVVAELIAATEHEDLAAAVRELGDRPLHGVVQFAAQI